MALPTATLARSWPSVNRRARLLRHAGPRQRLEPHPPYEGARQGRQGAPQRMLGPHLVIAVRHHQQRGQPPDPPSQPDEPVERGLVGPVDVLDHDHGPGPLPGTRQLLQEGREDLLLGRAGTQPVGQHSPGLPADVVKRPQRPRGDQPVAAAPQHPRPASPGELGDEHGLADARFTGHHRHAATPRALAQQIVEEIQRRRTLPQLHAPDRRPGIRRRPGLWSVLRTIGPSGRPFLSRKSA